MAATTSTIESFDTTTTSEDDIKGLVQLRIKAGAITSTYTKEGPTWVLSTVWNVIGQQ
jgi:hypothetical protein